MSTKRRTVQVTVELTGTNAMPDALAETIRETVEDWLMNADVKHDEMHVTSTECDDDECAVYAGGVCLCGRDAHQLRSMDEESV